MQAPAAEPGTVQELERILDDDNDMADMYLGRRRHLEALEDMTNPTSPRRLSSLNKDADVFGGFRTKGQDCDDGGPQDKAPDAKVEPIRIPVAGDLDPRHRAFTDHSQPLEEVEFRCAGCAVLHNAWVQARQYSTAGASIQDHWCSPS